MELTVFLAWAVLLVGVPLNALAAYLLLRASRERPQLRVLRERCVVAVVTTLVVLFFGVIFVNNDREVPWLGLDATKLITRTAMLVMALVSGGGWLWVYFRAFGRPNRKEGS